MGEYAKLKSNGQQVKIGTCEELFYLRHEDQDKVAYNFDGAEWFWRLPYPDEDDVPIGQYEPFNRGVRLYRRLPNEPAEDFTDNTTADDPGIVQLRHESGLLLNVPCYHGVRLPDVADGMKAFWNGKTHAFELAFVKNTAAGVLPVVRCRHCGNMWRYSWADVLPFVPDEKLRARLALHDRVAV